MQVIEEDMREMASKFKEDSTISFSHCISGDIGDWRCMTAGVAVTFESISGAPKETDKLNSYLIRQHPNGRAGVYGRVNNQCTPVHLYHQNTIKPLMS